MLQIEREENDADLKFLIFTEFVATQAMLYEFLTARGYSATMLNGGLGLEERRSVQQDFADATRILISTDAGGEGLNLQCAHVAINYDLPWSPTKIEQRIGRVDRIGQSYAVRAFNLVIQDSVDHRIQQVLAEKLAVILAEFGVDKTSDILDSAEAEADFDRLYREAVVNPQHIEQEVDALLATIRQRTAEARGALAILPEGDAPDISTASKLASHPLGLWVESLYVNSVLADGGIALRDDNGYRVRRKNETTWEAVRFYTRVGESESADAPRLIGLDDARVQALLNQTTRHGAGQPIPSWVVPGLAQGVTGFWSLWRVSLSAGDSQRECVFPLFVHDDGRVLNPSARHVWDILLRTNVEIQPSPRDLREPTETIYARIAEIARREGEGVYRALVDRQNALMHQERDKSKYAFAARRAAIERIGLANVRQKRLHDLENEEKRWADEMRRQEVTLADLQAVVMVHVSAKSDA
jgi:hypothetical protein